MRAGGFKNLLCLRGPLRIVAMYGEEDAAFLDLTFVTLRLKLGNAHANQSACNAAYRAADTCACQRGHDRTSCDERTDTWDREGTNASKQTESAT